MPKNTDIDIGLTALCLHAKQGETLTFLDIADVCGCSKQMIQKIESTALKKLKRHSLLHQYHSDLFYNQTPNEGLNETLWQKTTCPSLS